MTESGTTGGQAMEGQKGNNLPPGTPPQRRRRTKKKKKSNIKKYLEYLIWALVIIFIIGTIVMLFSQLNVKPEFKKKGSAALYNFRTLVG